MQRLRASPMQEAPDRGIAPGRQTVRLVCDRRKTEPEPIMQIGGRERAMKLIEKKLACTNLRELLKLIPDCFESVKSIDITIWNGEEGAGPNRRLSASVETHPKHGEYIVFEGMQSGPKVNVLRRQLVVERSAGDEQIGEIELFTLAEPPLKLRGVASKEDAEAVFGMISALIARTVDASLDGLTLLSNRKNLDDSLAKCGSDFVKEGRNFTAIMLDVDHFKDVNDTYGHNAGDFVLAKISSILLNGMRSVGFGYTIDSVGRYGGEEFVILLQDVGLEEAAAIAERLRESIRSHQFSIQKPASSFSVTCSFGIAQASEINGVSEGGVGEETLKLADSRLYIAKRRGRDRVEPESAVFDAAINA
jgi:diguanylate cyclase (GGDEF)-like protein